MLKVYDQNRTPLGMMAIYSNLKIDSDITTFDGSLSFETTSTPDVEIHAEYYIQTQKDEYVVKKVKYASDTKISYECVLNLEGLENKTIDALSVEDKTIAYAVGEAISGTGWEIGTNEISSKEKRNAGVAESNALQAVKNFALVWMCELSFDTLNKRINILKKVGSFKGCYFATGLNLKKISIEEDSYDFYTAIKPIGKDGLTIADVNDNKEIIENHQYSDKMRTFIWTDESYTDASILKEDAIKYLDEISTPIKSFSCDVVDLARQTTNYDIFSFELGDDVLIIDPITKTRDKQRIVKLTQHPQEPSKTKAELSTKKKRFTELLEQTKKTNEIIALSGVGSEYGTVITLSQLLEELKKEIGG